MEVPRHWRLKQQRYGLVGEVCPHCDFKIFPPRDVCPECKGEAKEPFAFSGKGEVYSYTTIYEAPSGYDVNAPYTVALVVAIGLGCFLTPPTSSDVEEIRSLALEIKALALVQTNGYAATFNVSTRGNRQSVAISSKGELRAVNISLAKSN